MENVAKAMQKRKTKEWVNKANLSSFELKSFFKFVACVISARKAKYLDFTTMFTYSHANTPLSQSERAYHFSYFIKNVFFSLVAGKVEGQLRTTFFKV